MNPVCQDGYHCMSRVVWRAGGAPPLPGMQVIVYEAEPQLKLLRRIGRNGEAAGQHRIRLGLSPAAVPI